MYTDDDILLGYVYTDEAIQNSAEFPTVAIESGFEKNPQMIMWDPATYPDVKTIADLGKTDIARPLLQRCGVHGLLHRSQGILKQGQGRRFVQRRPSLFVADEGKAAQQGFGSAEPYLYENVITDWMKPVKYQYINDAGWKNYAESIATKPENITKYADCFKMLVPIIQQSSVDYLDDPTACQQRSSSTRSPQFDKFGWVYDQGVADYARRDDQEGRPGGQRPRRRHRQLRHGSRQRPDRKAMPVYTALGQPPKEGLKAEDIVTNEFIDPSIGL